MSLRTTLFLFLTQLSLSAFAQTTTLVAASTSSPSVVKDYVTCITGNVDAWAAANRCDLKDQLSSEYSRILRDCNQKMATREIKRATDADGIKAITSMMKQLNVVGRKFFVARVNKVLKECKDPGQISIDEKDKITYSSLEITITPSTGGDSTEPEGLD